MLKAILLTIGFLAFLEGVIIVIFPKSVGKKLRKISNKKSLREIAIIEIITSLVFIALGFVLS